MTQTVRVTNLNNTLTTGNSNIFKSYILFWKMYLNLWKSISLLNKVNLNEDTLKNVTTQEELDKLIKLSKFDLRTQWIYKAPYTLFLKPIVNCIFITKKKYVGKIERTEDIRGQRIKTDIKKTFLLTAFGFPVWFYKTKKLNTADRSYLKI